MALLELATRAEQAGPNDQRHILELAWQEVYGHFPGSHESLPERTLLFARRLNAEAYLDAALMLVPEGCGFAIMGNGAKVGRHIGASSTPALALTAATLRARAKEGV